MIDLPLLLAGLSAVSAPPTPLPTTVAVDCVQELKSGDFRADPSCDPTWALRQTGLLAAHEALRKEKGVEPGTGVTVAHLDTGVSEHPELDLGARLFLDRGWSLECDEKYDEREKGHEHPQACPLGERRPEDRFQKAFPSMARQPGHGTRTLSVLASGTDGLVLGAAPGVNVVPYRATRGSVLSENRAWHMARAVERAVLDASGPRVDVITISFGRRSPNPYLARAVDLAERSGVIVVAAAGQFSISSEGGHVRFPAAHPSVTAVAGTTVAARPWGGFSGTSQGPEIDVSAPAFDVWRATTPGKAGPWQVGRGRGTSFAAPLVAGAAALWIHKHGRSVLEARYGKGGVAAAFRYLLHHEARRTPPELCTLATQEGWDSAPAICKDTSWNPGRMGEGILAADRLIQAQLPPLDAVCKEVFAERGAQGLALVCPDATVAAEALKQTLPRPAYHYDGGVSLVSSLTLGRPFGDVGGGFKRHVTPVFSYGVILGRHQFVLPKGALIQARAGEHGFAIGVGYARIVEYSPLRNGEDKYAVIPGFGPSNSGVAMKVGYMRARRRNFVGGELIGSLYRAKLAAGVYRALDDSPDKVRFTLEAGVGF